MSQRAERDNIKNNNVDPKENQTYSLVLFLWPSLIYK